VTDSISPAALEDAAAIAALLGELAQALGEADRFRSTPAGIRRHGFGPDRRLWTMLAWRGAAAVGIATYFPTFSTTRGAPGIYLQDLYVATAQRGSGLGRRLIAAAIADGARTWGATHLTLLVYDANTAARRFYAGLGFGLPDTERPATLEGAGVDALRINR
jgi:GNAT superfamily N-acetyltransferase